MSPDAAALSASIVEDATTLNAPEGCAFGPVVK
jgi:hypothetical protein